jgi:chromosome segregation ATPase
MSSKQAYEEKLQAKLDEWQADIKKLKAKADQAKADVKLQYYEEIERLERNREDLRHKLNDLKKTGGDAWSDLKAGIESAWHSLEGALGKARDRFK